jgi:GNAT superfamily N-acetyltransferase
MVELREESLTGLVEHAKIPIAFTVDCILDISTLTDGSFASAERAIQPYAKDYDAVEPPAQWAVRFDLTKWGLIAAYHSNNRVGGAVIAFDTPEIDLLEGRNDLALLWDIRVRPEVRYQGIGSALFRGRAMGARQRL